MSTIKALRGDKRDSVSNVNIHPMHIQHVRWLYKQFRQDGMDRGSARMNLVFALSQGQRDARTKVQEVLR